MNAEQFQRRSHVGIGGTPSATVLSFPWPEDVFDLRESKITFWRTPDHGALPFISMFGLPFFSAALAQPQGAYNKWVGSDFHSHLALLPPLFLLRVENVG